MAGDGTTDVARAFFAGAYMPLGNASYRWPAPDTSTGIGFGDTDADAAVMSGFVSTQTYALRSSTPSRFGFAVVPHNATAPDALSVEDRIAAAISGSDTAPGGACGTNGESCSGTVDGAQFNDAWKTFANTLEGSQVSVPVGPAVKVTFAAVTSRGATQVTTSTLKRAVPKGFKRRPGTLAYDVETTAAYGGEATVCVAYKPATYRGYSRHLFRLGSRSWIEVTTTVRPSAACGATTALGTFAVFAKPKHRG